MKTCLQIILIGFLSLSSYAAEIHPQDSSTQPDNTKTNKRDRSTDQPTADKQKENQADREISQKIRSSIVKDKGLSTYAHNAKVITQDGYVTLRGPVRSQEEKENLESKAAAVAGRDHVHNELDVAQKQ